jgi:hypothetical protein
MNKAYEIQEELEQRLERALITMADDANRILRHGCLDVEGKTVDEIASILVKRALSNYGLDITVRDTDAYNNTSHF